MNSVVIAALTVVISVTVSTLGGYAFARFSFPGKNILFLVTLAILMVPGATLLIPLYVLLRQLNLDNTLVGEPGPVAVPAAIRDLHDADLVRSRSPRARRNRHWSTAPARSMCCAGSCFPQSSPA